MVAQGDAVLKGLESPILKFEDLSASEADQMIVMVAFGCGFVPSLSVRKFSLGGKTEAGQKLQGPVDGGISDPGIGLGYLGINLGEVLVAGGAEKDLEDFLPLSGRLEPSLGEEFFEPVRKHKNLYLKLKFIFILRDFPLPVNPCDQVAQAPPVQRKN